MTLVLIHGAGCDGSFWDRAREHLSGIPMLVPTLPGRQGQTWVKTGPSADARWEIPSFAETVLAAMDAQGIERAVIGGHSMGGAIALWLALEHPERVAGLGLICTGARLRVRKEVLEALSDGMRGALDGIVAANATEHTSDRDRVALHRMLTSTGTEQTFNDLRACNEFDVMDRLSQIRCPVVVCGAEQDRVTFPEYARFLAASIPQARLSIFDKVGHLLSIERASEVAAELAVLWASSMPRAMR